MSDTSAIILTVSLIVLGSAVVFYLQHLSQKRNKKLAEEESEKYRRRLNSPDFGELETYFRHPLPDALKALYQDKPRINSEYILIDVPNPGELESESFIAFFEPLDMDSVRHPWPGCEKLLPFANNGAGDMFMVDPTHTDPEVLYYLHESRKIIGLGVTISKFLMAPYHPVSDD
jgi:hypothetical protein